MTIKELYLLALKEGKENAEIFINYNCDDSWYDVEEYLEKEQVVFEKNIIVIEL